MCAKAPRIPFDNTPPSFLTETQAWVPQSISKDTLLWRAFMDTLPQPKHDVDFSLGSGLLDKVSGKSSGYTDQALCRLYNVDSYEDQNEELAFNPLQNAQFSGLNAYDSGLLQSHTPTDFMKPGVTRDIADTSVDKPDPFRTKLHNKIFIKQ